MSNEEYHGDKTHISSSVIKNAFRGADFFEEQRLVASKTTAAMLLGTYLHTKILEPHLVDEEFCVYPGAVRRGKAYDAFLEENPGKQVLIQSELDMANILMKGYKECGIAQEMFTDGVPEQSFFTELDGVQVKVRADWLRNDGNIVDLKTTSSGLTDYDLSNAIRHWSYHLSAALYLDVVKQHTGVDGRFYFVFLSKKTGKCRVIEASDDLIQAGRQYYQDGLNKIKGFYEVDPVDYTKTISKIGLPEQMFQKEEV